MGRLLTRVVRLRGYSPTVFFDFLFGRRERDRDGSSPEKAVVVGSVGEKYAWMQRHYPCFRPGMQALQTIDGKPYDVLTWRDEKGEERAVYFDIFRFFGSGQLAC